MKRRRYSPEQKVRIIREHLEKNIYVPNICEKYRIHPNQFYRWKKDSKIKTKSLLNFLKRTHQVKNLDWTLVLPSSGKRDNRLSGILASVNRYCDNNHAHLAYINHRQILRLENYKAP